VPGLTLASAQELTDALTGELKMALEDIIAKILPFALMAPEPKPFLLSCVT